MGLSGDKQKPFHWVCVVSLRCCYGSTFWRGWLCCEVRHLVYVSVCRRTARLEKSLWTRTCVRWTIVDEQFCQSCALLNIEPHGRNISTEMCLLLCRMLVVNKALGLERSRSLPTKLLNALETCVTPRTVATVAIPAPRKLPHLPCITSLTCAYKGLYTIVYKCLLVHHRVQVFVHCLYPPPHDPLVTNQ